VRVLPTIRPGALYTSNPFKWKIISPCTRISIDRGELTNRSRVGPQFVRSIQTEYWLLNTFAERTRSKISRIHAVSITRKTRCNEIRSGCFRIAPLPSTRTSTGTRGIVNALKTAKTIGKRNATYYHCRSRGKSKKILKKCQLVRFSNVYFYHIAAGCRLNIYLRIYTYIYITRDHIVTVKCIRIMNVRVCIEVLLIFV